MQQLDKKQILVESLLAMRNSLVHSYEMRTMVKEEGLLLEAISNGKDDYVVFSDYRRNDGRRRILDAIEILDDTINEIKRNEYPEATKTYLKALRAVARMTKMAKVLEHHSMDSNFEKEGQGALAPKSTQTNHL